MNILIDGQTFETPEIHRGIGVYVKNVIEYMLKLDVKHEWYITICDETKLCELSNWTRNKLHVIQGKEFLPGIDFHRNQEYTEKLSDVIQCEKIDVFWIPNPLMVNVLFPKKALACSTYITVYDLIPYLFPIKEWGRNIAAEYSRRIQFLKENENIKKLFISNATKEDYQKEISAKMQGCVTPLAADHSLFYKQKSKEKNENQKHYIMFTGGFDYRKNIDGAIDSFKKAMDKYSYDKEFANYQLIIVGAYTLEIKEKYDEILKGKGLENKVEFTGYIDDKNLADLYQNADIFFFPSLYEGFGLPILEAMLGGAYVVSADNSSLPEVCGGYALLGNAKDINQMADLLYKAYLNKKTESYEDMAKRQEYARSYSWEKTATQTLKYLEQDYGKRFDGEKKNIAILTPWPEQETGIANFVYKIVPYIARYYNVDVYTEADPDIRKKIDEVNVKILSLKDFSENKDNYFRILYEIGNNVEFHKKIFEMFEKYPDVAEIHDLVLEPFFYYAYFLTGEKKKFNELLEMAYGKEGINEYEQLVKKGCSINEQKFPMGEVIVKKANKTIVHNHWSKHQLKDDHTVVIPHACFEEEIPPQIDKDLTEKNVKEKIDIQNQIIIGCFGWVNMNKRPLVVMKAVEKLVLSGKNVKLVFWGKCNCPEAEDYIRNHALQKHIVITGFLNKMEYQAAMNLTDIVVNLRYPSMGESSGTLCESFKCGKPVIVSDINQYREYPDEVCWKLPVDRNEEKILIRYLERLIEQKDVKNALSQNAKNYADNVLSLEQIAYQYYCFLES